MRYTPTEAESEIIRIIKDEITEWENGHVYVTDKVSYDMKDIIQKARMNYLGKYDQDKDEVTDKKKIFVPFTEDMVETIVKNIDLDSADINIKATNPNGYSAATILRYLLSHFMKRNYFGEILNEMLRLFCIDGTVITKVLKNYDKKLGSQAIKTRIVDTSNFYIDPNEDNIQNAGAVIERHILKRSELKDYPWDNKEHVEGYTDIAKLGSVANTAYSNTQVPYIEVYERWGEMPEWVLKNKPRNDDDKWVPTVSLVANIHRSAVVLKIKENKKEIKPYEECRFRKVFGRWHGRGIGEILQNLQSYINETVNLRLNKARITQLGLFKVRKGSGITQQLLTSLVSGGVIPVTRMEDIQELPMSDVKGSSYTDEETAYKWGQRTTGAWDVGKGESLPASMPATTAVLQERGMRSGMDLLQENLGMFLSRVFERHIIPYLIETIKEEEIISIIGSPEELKEIDENYINSVLNKNQIDSISKTGKFLDPQFAEHLKGMYRDNLDRFQKTRYFSLEKKFLKGWEYEVEVFVTGESFNKAVMVQQLNELLMGYSNLPGANLDIDAVMKEVLDLMGLGGARFIKKQEQHAPLPEMPRPGAASPSTPRGETEMVGEAATGERLGRGLTPTM